ncbi:MAG: methyl-accepting chemotaxis protein, partial [Humidesulfovibrio sp.]|nr:methyl-accepting chemotaxis protein [Humidesulfovibrio sp.]
MPRRTISLQARLWGTAVLALVGSIALLAVSLRSIDEVKIRSPLYLDIIAYKDLLADILPPPHYLIESYLTGFELIRAQGEEREALIKKVGQLEKDFLDRNAVWHKWLTHQGLRQSLLDEATPAGLQFFKVMKESFLPLLRQGRDSEAREVLDGPLTTAYRAHRAGVDKTVELANAEVLVVEGKADSLLSSNVNFLYYAAGVINALLIMLTFFAIRSIMGPMSRLITYAASVSEGDYDADCDVPAQGEIGHLAEVLKATVRAVRDSIAKAGKSELMAQEESQKAHSATAEANEAKVQAERAKAEGMIAAATHLEQVVDGISSALQQLSAQVEQSNRGTEVQ